MVSTRAPSTFRQGNDPSPRWENRGLSHRGVRVAARWVDHARRHVNKHWAEQVWTEWQSTGGADPGPLDLTTQMGLQGKPHHFPARSPSLCGCTPQECGPDPNLERNDWAPLRTKRAAEIQSLAQDLLRIKSLQGMGRRDDPDADADRPGVKDNQTGQAWYLSPGAPVHRLTQTPCCSGHHQGRVLAQPKEGENGIESQKLSYTRDFQLALGPLSLPNADSLTEHPWSSLKLPPQPVSTTQPAGGPQLPQQLYAPWPEQQEAVGWRQPTWLATACSLFLSSCFIF